MTEDQDFSDYPKSITELKSDKTQRGGDWTVRDALISALRDLDAGIISADYCILILGIVEDDDSTCTYFYNCTPNRYILHGLVGDLQRRLIVKECTGEF